MVAADRDGVEFRHFGGRVFNDVANDAHRRLRRVDVGVAHHEFFQNVILNRACQLVLAHALLFSRDHIAGQDWQHGAVHGHRDGNFVERDLVEEDFHVFNAVDRYAGLADIARDARMVGVIAAVRGQVERDRHALPARSQGFAVESVGFFGGREACVLTDRPWAHRIHGRLRPTNEGLVPWQGVGVRQVFDVFGGVERLDDDAVGRFPVQGF